MTERMIGWSVTTLTMMDTIQKLEKTAIFWMSGMGAIETRRMPMPSLSAEAMVLLVVAVHRLDGVREGARGEEDRHHQHERIEVEAEERPHAERPHAREEPREDRHPDAGPGAEVVPEEEGERRDGDDEHLAHLGHVAQHRGVEPREAGDVDGVVRVLDVARQLHHAIVEVAEV